VINTSSSFEVYQNIRILTPRAFLDILREQLES